MSDSNLRVTSLREADGVAPVAAKAAQLRRLELIPRD